MMALKLEERFRFHAVNDIKIDAWSDRYRRLPSATSAVPGQWKTSHVEAFRGAMVAFDDPNVKLLSVCSAVQMGKTELLLGIIGRTAQFDPAPMLLVEPKEDAAAKFTRERLAPMIRECPELRKKFDPRARMGDDSLSFKSYSGGFIAIEGAASPMNLAMRAAKYVLMDEIDKYEVTKEGHPVHLAEARCLTFGDNAKRVRVCSPTSTDKSFIWQSYQQSDRRRAWIACPNCERLFSPTFFGNVEWQKSDSGEHFPMTAAIFCPGCNMALTEDQRRKIITTERGIVWRQGRPFSCCGIEDQIPTEWDYDEENQIGIARCPQCGGHPVPRDHAGYQVSQLLSPFVTAQALVAEWLQAKENPDDKLTFRNTRLGEPADVEQIIENVDTASLMERRENFPDYVPGDVCGLFLGADVQTGSDVSDGSIHAYLYGVTPDRQMYSVWTQIFEGDVRLPAVWDQFDRLLLSRFPHECGANIIIQAAAVDAGDGKISDIVIEFCKKRRARNIYAVKGMSERAGASWGEIWPGAKATVSRETGYRVKMIGSNAAKMSIYTRLSLPPGAAGSLHFGMDWTPERFAQLTAEKYSRIRRGAFESRKFVLPRGKANEALDGTAYALVALQGWLSRPGNSLEKSANYLAQFKEKRNAS